jgi:hypothetical protein
MSKTEQSLCQLINLLLREAMQIDGIGILHK